MTTFIHPDAMVSKSAVLGPGVWIGPDVVVGANVRIGAYSVIGGHPEHRDFYDDIDFKKTKGVLIEPGARIFEFVTIHQGTIRPTFVGPRVAVFNKTHIAHDCRLESGCVIGGQVSLAGHVQVMPHANVSGKSCIVQWAVIGAHAFVGGFTFVTKHIPPGEKWIGFPAKPIGHNDVGLQRAGISYEDCLTVHGERFKELTKEKHL